MENTVGNFTLLAQVQDRDDGFNVSFGWCNSDSDPRHCLALRWSEKVHRPTGYPLDGQWFTLP
ncbi:MAG: hypothetical protein AAFY15_10060, partial [Cyanobacteria bacterium J06648_11]